MAVSARSESTTFAMPKSATFQSPWAVDSTLLGFTSRWIRPMRCAAPSPSSTWQAIVRTACDAHRTSLELVGEAPPFEELHHDEGVSAVDATVEDGDDVRVDHLSGCPSLGFDSRAHRRMMGHVSAESFQRDLTLELVVPCGVDLAHAPTADHPAQHVAISDHRRRVFSIHG